MSCQGIPAKLVGKGLAYLSESFGDGVLEPHVRSGADKRILWSSPSITGEVIDMNPKAIAYLKTLGWEWYEFEDDPPDFPNPDRNGYFYIS